MKTTRTFYHGKYEERIYSTVEIPNGFTFLLHFKEGWTIMTNSRLPISQSMDSQEHTSPSSELRHYGQNQSLWS